MQQQQDFINEQITIEKQIQSVFNNFEFIKNNIKEEFPSIPKKSQVLIFLGEFEKNLYTFYQNLQQYDVVINKKYYKLIRITIQGETRYLLNFPLIVQQLQNDDKYNEMALNLCISKIYAEKAFQKMENCSYSIIICSNSLNGDDDQAKMKKIIDDSVFSFGSYHFKANQFICLRRLNEDSWNLYKIKLKDKWKQEFELHTQEVTSNNVFESILKVQQFVTIQQKGFKNYGQMTSFIQEQQVLLAHKFNDLMLDFQKQLLMLQQISLIQSPDGTKQKIGNYLKELQQGLPLNQENSNIHRLSNISNVFTFLNNANQRQDVIDLNQRIEEDPEREQFFNDNKITTLCIKPFFNDEILKKLNSIIDFLNFYNQTLCQCCTIIEVQKLQINLLFWCQYFDNDVENTIYELKYIADRIQEEPKNVIENGIYFVGVTKSGKSTIINKILNPDKLQIISTSNLQYQILKEFKTKFEIGESCVSETQKIQGFYTGQEKQLNKIMFNQENVSYKDQENIFSYEKLQKMGLINKLNIPENWFIFDCPGFDHNTNELMAIAHRISLYNYLKKTQNVILYFVIDISKQDVNNIKNTFDPIVCFLKNNNELQHNFKDWANIILTKGEVDSRQYYLQNWNKAYKRALQQKYGYYEQLFADDERCLEFIKPSKERNEDIYELSKKIIQTTTKQLQLKQHNNPSFQLTLDDKLWWRYEQCIPKIQIKLELLFKLFIQELDQYLIQDEETIEQKKEQLQKLQNYLMHQQNNNVIREINLDNCNSILQRLSQWVKVNKNTQKIFFFLEAYIQDIQAIFKIQEYCKNNEKKVPFQIKIDDFVNRVQNMLKIIEEIEEYERTEQQKYKNHQKVFLFCYFSAVSLGTYLEWRKAKSKKQLVIYDCLVQNLSGTLMANIWYAQIQKMIEKEKNSQFEKKTKECLQNQQLQLL